ncbi:hypothetical protein [Micromonospora matsumotoense]|uniref:hypothetical protein n=1 Tax=Micromonospora matsumotoense TaxID=121616 RepID=UPI00159F2343|nr:hypothetical protein [Micromonospora matsumotoense]
MQGFPAVALVRGFLPAVLVRAALSRAGTQRDRNAARSDVASLAEDPQRRRKPR